MTQTSSSPGSTSGSSRDSLDEQARKLFAQFAIEMHESTDKLDKDRIHVSVDFLLDRWLKEVGNEIQQQS